jgi:D-glycero-alpha-D-manno-heptose-7-phosphate kinase
MQSRVRPKLRTRLVRGCPDRPFPLPYILIPNKRHCTARKCSNHTYLTRTGRLGVHDVLFTTDSAPGNLPSIRMVSILRITAKAPCRVDLAGATLDIWPLYLFHENVVTVNFAVNLYTRCVIETRPDSRIVLRSRDLNDEESFESLEHLQAAKKYRLPLLAFPVRFFAPKLGIKSLGINVESHSEAPAGAGISGSSALMIAATSALNHFTGSKYKIEKLREISQNIEAQVIRVPTGAQDYYPAMYGGVSAIGFGPAGILRTALPVDPTELNQRFILVYTGAPRNSGINNWEVTKRHIDGDRKIHRNFDRIAAIACALRQALTIADWRETARLMRDEWTYRRRNLPGITTPLIDDLVKAARRAGSTAAKVCGAGGGGCVVFLTEPDKRERVIQAIQSASAGSVKVLPAHLAPHGVTLKVWP